MMADKMKHEVMPDDPIERAQQIQEILELTLRQTVVSMNPPRLGTNGQPIPRPGPEALMRAQLAADVTIIQVLAFLVEVLIPEASVKRCRDDFALKHAKAQGEG